MTYNNRDGKVITKPGEKGVIIKYVDPNDFIKQVRGLRTYYMRSYKDLMFNVSFELKKPRQDGDYTIKLYTEETNEDEQQVELTLAKHREGKKAKLNLIYNRTNQIFEEE